MGAKGYDRTTLTRREPLPLWTTDHAPNIVTVDARGLLTGNVIAQVIAKLQRQAEEVLGLTFEREDPRLTPRLHSRRKMFNSLYVTSLRDAEWHPVKTFPRNMVMVEAFGQVAVIHNTGESAWATT